MSFKYHVGRALTTDWSTNNFVMVVCEKFRQKFNENFRSKARQKIIFS